MLIGKDNGLNTILRRFNKRAQWEMADIIHCGLIERYNNKHFYSKILHINVSRTIFRSHLLSEVLPLYSDKRFVITIGMKVSQSNFIGNFAVKYLATICDYDEWISDPINAKYVELLENTGFYIYKNIYIARVTKYNAFLNLKSIFL